MTYAEAVLATLKRHNQGDFTGRIRRAKWDTIPRNGLTQDSHYAILDDHSQENFDADDWEFYEPEPYRDEWRYDPETGWTYEKPEIP